MATGLLGKGARAGGVRSWRDSPGPVHQGQQREREAVTDRGLDWKGRRYTVEVGPVAHGGHCVARAEGRVVFVRHVLPGEQVEVEITEDPGGSFCRGEVVQLLQ